MHDYHQIKHFLPNFSEYEADKIKDKAASKPNIKLDAKDEVITKNSPTNPEVPGKPEFAIRKKSSLNENIGMNWATP